MGANFLNETANVSVYKDRTKNKTNKMMRLLSLSLLSLFLFASCAQEGDMDTETLTEEDTNVIEMDAGVEKATAVLYPTEGNETGGVVVFTQTDQGVRVEAIVTGLDAESRHGFHIHQYGDCRAPDGTSAGGHYNPTAEEHGAPTADLRHMGDLGNLPVNAQGTADADFLDEHLELNGPNSIIGQGVIVHAGEDDFETQPTGAAGARLACGVIGEANPEVTIRERWGMD